MAHLDRPIELRRKPASAWVALRALLVAAAALAFGLVAFAVLVLALTD